MVSAASFVTDDVGTFSRSVRPFLPVRATLPVLQFSGGTDMVLRVAVGDRVREGQVLAESYAGATHASIPGMVERIGDCELPDGKRGTAVTVALSGSFTYTGKRLMERPWQDVPPELLCAAFASRGVVNTFRGCRSLAMQVRSLQLRSARLLVLRLFDDDPSRVTERFLAAHEAERIAAGTALIARAMLADGIILVRGKRGPEPPAVGQHTTVPVTEVMVDDSRYPAGFEQDIVAAVRRQCGESPWREVSTRALYVDAETAVGAYEAVAFDMPVMERYVHVTGACLRSAAVLRVRLGTTMGELAALCGGFTRAPTRIVVNGVVAGTAVGSMDVPVTKAVKSVLFQSGRQVERPRVESCVRCGDCRAVCPAGLLPDMLYRAFMHGEHAADRDRCAARTAPLCSHCGLCNAVCPSRLPLSHAIALL